MNNNKQSALEWYYNEIGKLFNQFIVDKITIYEFRNQQLKLKQQAKAMHKEEIIEAFDEGQEYEYQYHIDLTPKFYSETYYNETFGGNNEQQ